MNIPFHLYLVITILILIQLSFENVILNVILFIFNRGLLCVGIKDFIVISVKFQLEKLGLLRVMFVDCLGTTRILYLRHSSKLDKCLFKM